jgi:gluconate 2-dehydrogenase gamma chain
MEREDPVLVALADTVFPAGDGLGSASELGAVGYVRERLAGPWGRGENRYGGAPFVQPDHGGHGWQWPESPAQAVTHLLDVLDEASRARYGRPFDALADAERTALVTDVDDGRLGDPLATAAFTLLCVVVLEGVLAHPRHGGNAAGAAWRWLGHPGGGR